MCRQCGNDHEEPEEEMVDRTMGLCTLDELTQVELLIQQSRLSRHSEQVNSGRLKVCVRTKPAYEPPMGLIVTDGFIQQFENSVVIQPWSMRCALWFDEHLSQFKTATGYRFNSKEELGLTAAGNFQYTLTDSEGYPCD